MERPEMADHPTAWIDWAEAKLAVLRESINEVESGALTEAERTKAIQKALRSADDIVGDEGGSRTLVATGIWAKAQGLDHNTVQSVVRKGRWERRRTQDRKLDRRIRAERARLETLGL